MSYKNSVCVVALALVPVWAVAQSGVAAPDQGGPAGTSGKILGVTPESNLIIFRESDGRNVMRVNNPASHPFLVSLSINEVGTGGPAVLALNPNARVGPKQGYGFRFRLEGANTKKGQQFLYAMTIRSVPPKGGDNEVQVALNYVVPLLFHPQGLEWDATPWKHLQACRGTDGASLQLINPSPYVVRMFPGQQGQPGSVELKSSTEHPAMLAYSTRAYAVPSGVQDVAAIRLIPAPSGEAPPPYVDVPVQGVCRPAGAATALLG
jgi:P pilus assembly chaperone PapD